MKAGGKHPPSADHAGTGKTSLVMALAGALELEIYVVTLSR
jgi:MoxR-like ATPase